MITKNKHIRFPLIKRKSDDYEYVSQGLIKVNNKSPT